MNSTSPNSDSHPPSPSRVLVIGGYGVFGSHVSRELAARGMCVTVAGRNSSKAVSFAQSLGGRHSGESLDLKSPDSMREAVADHDVAVQCAGPFSQQNDGLLLACLEAGCHYVDIADDRQYCQLVRDHHEAFAARQLVAAYGCSSLPAISLAAAMDAARERDEQPLRVRVTLFIGNRNQKGHGAVASAAQLIGRSIAAPQGDVRGFCDRHRVRLPPPFGERTVVNFESPDLDLLPERLGTGEVQVKVGFEMSFVTTTFWLLANTLPAVGRAIIPHSAALSGPLNRIGSSGGAVMAELTWSDGTECCVAVVAREDGQRMASLPAVYVAEGLCKTEAPHSHGAQTAVDILGAGGLLERLAGDGYEVVRPETPQEMP